MHKVEWKDIDGFEDYQISDDGQVKSKFRFVGVKSGKIKIKPIEERILKPAISGSGYEFVCLRKDNSHHNKRIHKLVADHFCDGYKKGLVVHHIDEDKLNNHRTNLEYTSMQKNTRNYFESKGNKFGGVPYCDIPSVIQRINNGEMCYKVAKEYGVTRNDVATISKVILLTGEELELKK